MKAAKATKYIIQWTELFFNQCKQILLRELSIINHLYLVWRFQMGREHRQKQSSVLVRNPAGIGLEHKNQTQNLETFGLPNSGVGMREPPVGGLPVIWQSVRQMSWWTAGVEAWTALEGAISRHTWDGAISWQRCNPQVLHRRMFMFTG